MRGSNPESRVLKSDSKRVIIHLNKFKFEVEFQIKEKKKKEGKHKKDSYKKKDHTLILFTDGKLLPFSLSNQWRGKTLDKVN